MTPSSEATDAPRPRRVGPVDLGSLGLNDLVTLLDDRVDSWFEPLRGNQVADAAARVVSGLGDRGLLWAALKL